MHTVNTNNSNDWKECSACVQPRVLEAIWHGKDSCTNVSFDEMNQSFTISEEKHKRLPNYTINMCQLHHSKIRKACKHNHINDSYKHENIGIWKIYHTLLSKG